MPLTVRQVKSLCFLCFFLLIVISSIEAQVVKQPLHEGWQFQEAGKPQSYPAEVPGTVHTDLLRNKLIVDPFFGDHEKRLQWIGHRDWVYTLKFQASPEILAKDHIELVCEGLDTYAEVNLNGRILTETDNMFRTWRIDLKGKLQPGENLLKLTFGSAIAKGYAAYRKAAIQLPAPNDDSDVKVAPYVRKAQYHFGWDWGPRFVTAGIWRPISLEAWNDLKIQGTYLQTTQLSADQKAAELQGFVEVYADKAGPATIQLMLGKQIVKQTANLMAGTNKLPVAVKVANPQLWWPAGYGKPFLYNTTWTITQGNAKASKSEAIGIRTLAVVHETDAAGKSLYIKVNGKPIFMKGANMIPLDAFLPRAKDSAYAQVVANAKSANMNMIRVWGGGIYEDDAFYKHCDEQGILVWQDFMFACALYPGSKTFLRSVEAEARDNIRRIRNHPSVALYCGSNENEQGWYQWGWWSRNMIWSHADSVQLKADFDSLYSALLPRVVAQEDPSRFYHTSSPSANVPGKVNEKGWGDRHDWQVWFSNVPFSQYEKNVSRFVSEYGFQSYPTYNTVLTFTKEKDRDVLSGVMAIHQKHENGNAKIKRFMEPYFKVPTKFEDLIYISQVNHGLAMKVGIEAHRRAQLYCMGSLYWQLNDCWPVNSWSSVDYYNNWKATHYAVKRAFQSMNPNISVYRDTLRLSLLSESAKPMVGTWTATLKRFDGSRVKSWSGKLNAIEGNNWLDKQPLTSAINLADTSNSYLELSINIGKETLVTTDALVVSKNLNLPKAEIVTTMTYVNGIAKLVLSSSHYQRYIMVSSPLGRNWSDNYFDLQAAEEKAIEMALNPTEFDALKASLKVKSLRDTYE